MASILDRLKSLGIGVKNKYDVEAETDPYIRYLRTSGAVRGEPFTPEIAEARRRYMERQRTPTAQEIKEQVRRRRVGEPVYGTSGGTAMPLGVSSEPQYFNDYQPPAETQEYPEYGDFASGPGVLGLPEEIITGPETYVPNPSTERGTQTAAEDIRRVNTAYPGGLFGQGLPQGLVQTGTGDIITEEQARIGYNPESSYEYINPLYSAVRKPVEMAREVAKSISEQLNEIRQRKAMTMVQQMEQQVMEDIMQKEQARRDNQQIADLEKAVGEQMASTDLLRQSGLFGFRPKNPGYIYDNPMQPGQRGFQPSDIGASFYSRPEYYNDPALEAAMLDPNSGLYDEEFARTFNNPEYYNIPTRNVYTGGH